jgi:hypothetical protein
MTIDQAQRVFRAPAVCVAVQVLNNQGKAIRFPAPVNQLIRSAVTVPAEEIELLSDENASLFRISARYRFIGVRRGIDPQFLFETHLLTETEFLLILGEALRIFVLEAGNRRRDGTIQIVGTTRKGESVLQTFSLPLPNEIAAAIMDCFPRLR